MTDNELQELREGAPVHRFRVGSSCDDGHVVVPGLQRGRPQVPMVRVGGGTLRLAGEAGDPFHMPWECPRKTPEAIAAAGGQEQEISW